MGTVKPWGSAAPSSLCNILITPEEEKVDVSRNLAPHKSLWNHHKCITAEDEWETMHFLCPLTIDIASAIVYSLHLQNAAVWVYHILLLHIFVTYCSLFIKTLKPFLSFLCLLWQKRPYSGALQHNIGKDNAFFCLSSYIPIH